MVNCSTFFNTEAAGTRYERNMRRPVRHIWRFVKLLAACVFSVCMCSSPHAVGTGNGRMIDWWNRIIGRCGILFQNFFGFRFFPKYFRYCNFPSYFFLPKKNLQFTMLTFVSTILPILAAHCVKCLSSLPPFLLMFGAVMVHEFFNGLICLKSNTKWNNFFPILLYLVLLDKIILVVF